MNSSRDVLAIAVDFGTTYSGIAYQIIPRNPTGQTFITPYQITRWPGQPPNRETAKVPTRVAYCNQPGYPVLWGYHADKPPHNPAHNIHYTRMKNFKIFLDPLLGPDNAWEPEAPGKTVSDCVQDFLEGMYQHMAKMLQDEGRFESVYDYQVLFTVPAPFSNAAVEAFRRCVQNTGFGRHQFDVGLTEPEAAAVYTLSNQRSILQRNNPFQTEQCLLVCDAGGGTVDISSYTIRELHPQIRVEQTGEVDGDLYGSSFIDKAFRDYIASLLGEATIRSLLPLERDALTDQFILAKEAFTNTEPAHIRLPRDNMNCPGQVSGYLPISPEKMRTMFERPVAETCELVRRTILRCAQKGHIINFVFLVGGFGTSPYLKQRLEETIQTIRLGAVAPIIVIRPSDAQQSVVLGCLATQLQRIRLEEDPVKIRLARAHYGLLSMRRFDWNIHGEHERYVHPITGEELARDQITWFIAKGDAIHGLTKPIDKDLVRTFKKVASVWTETLVRFNGDVAPDRLDAGVEVVCKLESDLRSCEVAEFEKRKKPNGKWCGMGSEKYYEAQYTVRMHVGTADVKFEMWYRQQLRSDLLTVSWEKLGDGMKG